MPTRQHTLQTFGGVIVLGIALAALTPLMLIAYFAGGAFFVIDILWFMILVAMARYGHQKRKPGYIAAPFVFCALWFAASVTQRAILQARIDPKVWAAPVAAEAKTYRTLILPYIAPDPTIIADGHVDRIIILERPGQEITRIVEVSLASGDACSAEEVRWSQQLQRTGRATTCVKWRDLSYLPDGLVIEYPSSKKSEQDSSGCCIETRVIARENGQGRTLFSWYQGRATVVSYIPNFGWASRPLRPGVWSAGGGLFHPVLYGQAQIDPKSIVRAIYDVAPSYGQNTVSRPVRAPDDPATRMDRAAGLADLPNGSSFEIARLLTAAQRAGTADDRAVDIAATLVGRSVSLSELVPFVGNLDDTQLVKFLEKVFDRLETPGICPTCWQRGTSPRDAVWELRERLPAPEAFIARALHIFTERSDLAPWQYAEALRIMLALMPPESRDDSRSDRLFNVLLADESPAFAAKALAYTTVNPHISWTANAQSPGCLRVKQIPDPEMRQKLRPTYCLR